MSERAGTGAEAERRLVAAAERHRKVLNWMQEPGRPDAGQVLALKAVDHAVRLVCFALRRGAAAGIPEERLVELTGWDPALVAQGLEQRDEERFVARLVPSGLDRAEIARTAAGVRATAEIHHLADEILDHMLDDRAGAPSPSDLEELHRSLTATWTDWRARSGSDVAPGRRARARASIRSDLRDATSLEDELAVRAIVTRLSRASASGESVIERAAIMAEGANSHAIIKWILAHGGRPGASAPNASARGLHGARSSGDPGRSSHYVMPADILR